MNDFPFDFVNSSTSLQKPPDPSEPEVLTRSSADQQHDAVQAAGSMPTPISPHGQQGDKVSGLRFLTGGSALAVGEAQIPQGLFIDVGVVKSGFLGMHKIQSPCVTAELMGQDQALLGLR